MSFSSTRFIQNKMVHAAEQIYIGVREYPYNCLDEQKPAHGIASMKASRKQYSSICAKLRICPSYSMVRLAAHRFCPRGLYWSRAPSVNQAKTVNLSSGCFWCSFRSCPHAAAASIPRDFLILTGTRALSRTSANALMCALSGLL